MKTEVLILIKNILFLFSIVFIGFITYNKKVISENVKDSISILIVKITAPALLFTTISNTRYSTKLLHDVIIMIVTAFFIIFFLMFIGVLTSNLFKLQDTTKQSHIFCNAFGNTGFLSFPIMYALFGEKGIFYAASFNITHDFLAWTIGIKILNNKTENKNIFGFLNPNSIAVISGFLFFLIKGLLNQNDNIVIKFIYDALNPLGKTTIPLSMLFIGCILAEISIKEAFKTVSIYSIVVLKMILMPILVMYITYLLGISNFTRLILTMQTAMPTATISSVLAYRYNSDAEYSAKAVVLTTLISIFTLPLILIIFK